MKPSKSEVRTSEDDDIPIPINIPDQLKLLLTEDWKLITKENQVFLYCDNKFQLPQFNQAVV